MIGSGGEGWELQMVDGAWDWPTRDLWIVDGSWTVDGFGITGTRGIMNSEEMRDSITIEISGVKVE